MPEPLVRRSTCDALVITCSDFRFKSAEREFELSLGLCDEHDLIARPGAIRSLVRPRSQAFEATMREEISLLHALHRFTRVIAINHLSCRAYDDVADESNERALHSEDLRRARASLEETLPGATVEAYFVELTPEGPNVVAVE